MTNTYIEILISIRPFLKLALDPLLIQANPDLQIHQPNAAKYVGSAIKYAFNIYSIFLSGFCFTDIMINTKYKQLILSAFGEVNANFSFILD